MTSAPSDPSATSATSEPTDDELLEALQAHAQQARRDRRLPVPPADSVQVRHAADGSRVTLDARIAQGRVQALGYQVRACSIGQAATMILARHAEGMDLAGLRTLRAQVQAVLAGGHAPRERPELAVFRLVQDVPSRHASVLLPFDALEQLFSRAAGHGDASPGNFAGNSSAKE